MNSPGHHRLIVPAPWGLPIMLGLQASWPSPHAVPAGTRLDVWHGPSGGDFRRVLDWCQTSLEGRRPSLSLIGLISPWTLVLSDHLVGGIVVAGCDPPSGQNPLYRLRLAEPRPVWAEVPQAQAAVPPVSAYQPRAPRPAAGPLFGGQA